MAVPGEAEPGVALGVAPLCGFWFPVGGLTEPVGGATVPVGGVPELVPELGEALWLLPAAPLVRPAPVCAAAQLAQAITANNNTIPLVDIFEVLLNTDL